MENIKREARSLRPPRIEDLWRRSSKTEERKACDHIQSEHLDWWATEDEVSELLNDEERLKQIDVEFGNLTFQIGAIGREYSQRLRCSNSIFVNPQCSCCNYPYDSGGCQHPGSPKTVPMFDPQINQIAHDTLTMLSVITYLVAYEFAKKNTNKLARLLVPTRYTGVFRNPLSNIRYPTPSIALVWCLLPNCSRFFPKIAHKAAGLISLLIFQSPAEACFWLDDKVFTTSMFNYLVEVHRLMHSRECLVEEHYGIVAFLNILPALYHLGNWNEAKSSENFNPLCGFLACIMADICYEAITTEDPAPDILHLIDDSPIDSDHWPYKVLSGGPKVLMEALLMVKKSDTEHDALSSDWRIQFMHKRPRTFAVMAALETFGWWMSQGIDLSLGEVVCDDGPPKNIKSFILENRPGIRLLIQGSPRPLDSSKYLEPLMDAIIAGGKETPNMKIREPGISLLYRPFIHDNRRCGHCQKTADDLGRDLLRCRGGCGGLQLYCSKEHQQRHWHEHKLICKKNGNLSQHTGK